jgi:hypothetical protein
MDIGKKFVGEVVSARFNDFDCLMKLNTYVGVIVSLLPLNNIDVVLDHDEVLDDCRNDGEYMMKVSAINQKML